MSAIVPLLEQQRTCRL